MHCTIIQRSMKRGSLPSLQYLLIYWHSAWLWLLRRYGRPPNFLATAREWWDLNWLGIRKECKNQHQYRSRQTNDILRQVGRNFKTARRWNSNEFKLPFARFSPSGPTSSGLKWLESDGISGHITKWEALGRSSCHGFSPHMDIWILHSMQTEHEHVWLFLNYCGCP